MTSEDEYVTIKIRRERYNELKKGAEINGFTIEQQTEIVFKMLDDIIKIQDEGSL